MNLIQTNKKVESVSKNLKIFLYGDSFVGKTTFASTFPKPILISTDGNFKHIDIDYVKISDVMERKLGNGATVKESGWLSFKQVVNELTNGQYKDNYETIIVDIVKDIYDMCTKYVLDQQGVIHESDIKQQGKIWTLFDREFMPVLRQLMTCDKNIILITHEKDREGKIIPTTISSVTSKLQQYVDINARMIIKQVPGKEGFVTLVARPTAGQSGGNRLGITEQIANPNYTKLVEELNKLYK